MAQQDGDHQVAQRRIAAARAYIDALVSHDPAEVALHPECTRFELGVKTGRNGPHIARSLAHGPQFLIIWQIGNLEATVDGHSVTTRYDVFVRPKLLGLGARVSETFVIDEDYRIRAIVARFGIPRRIR